MCLCLCVSVYKLTIKPELVLKKSCHVIFGLEAGFFLLFLIEGLKRRSGLWLLSASC